MRATWVEFRSTLDDESAFHRLVAGIRGREPGPTPGQAAFAGECPYRGLQFFDVEHAPFFFGREALTGWLLEALRGNNRFLAIIGPSGSGKSSLARAGLMAALRRGGLTFSDQWPTAIFRPGPHPLENLAVALSTTTNETTSRNLARMMDELAGDQRTVHLTVRLALRQARSEQRFVLLVDQFEEIFALCRDESQCRALIDNLLYAASVAGGQTVIILTLRADFYGKCAGYPALAAALAEHQVLVGPMDDDELRSAIERPAHLVGCEFEPGLIDRLLTDVQDQPGGLPLLQHALLELWARRKGNKLTHAAYEALGGVAGALERRAEEVYGNFSEVQQAACRRIFLRLTQPGEGTEDTKRRAAVGELLPAEGNPQAIEDVISALTRPNTRLITTEGTGEQRFVEVSHEALIRGWSRLREWIDQDREALRTQRRLTDAAQEWEQHEQEESYLYRGGRLAEADEWATAHAADLSRLERTFLDASLALRDQEKAERDAQQQRELKHALTLASEQAARAEIQTTAARRLRRQALVLAVTSILAILLAAATGVFAVRATSAQAKAERQTRRAVADELAANAKSVTNDPSLSLLLGQEAIRTTLASDEYASPNSMQALVEAIEKAPPWRMTIPRSRHLGIVNSAAFDPSGTRIVTAGEDQTARVWNAQTGAEEQRLIGHTGPVHSAVFNAQGTPVLTASDDGTARIWDAISGEELIRLTLKTKVYSAQFDAQGDRVVTAGEDQTARIWSVRTGKELIRLRGHTAAINSASFNLQGTHVVTASDDRTARIWDAASGKEILRLSDHWGSVRSAAFDADGQRVVTTGLDGIARVWAADTGAQLNGWAGGAEMFNTAFFSPVDGNVITAGGNGVVRLWDARSGSRKEILAVDGGAVISANISPEGERLVTVGWDETARVWNLATGKVISRLGSPIREIYTVDFSPDQSRLVIAGRNTTALIVDVTNGDEILSLIGHSQNILSATYANGGDRIVTASFDKTARIWDSSTGQELLQLVGHEGAVRSASFSRDDKQVVTASSDQTARVWDSGSGVQLLVLKGHSDAVNSAVFSSKGDLIATAGNDSLVRIWNAHTGEELRQLHGHQGPVRSVAFDAQGVRVVTAGEDGTVRIWDADSGEELLQYRGHKSIADTAVFNPVGDLVLSASHDETAHVWNASTGETAVTLQGHLGVVGQPDSAKADPKSQRAAVTELLGFGI